MILIFALSRAFKFGERKQLLLAFDAFDVFNRQNINEVTSVYGGGTPDFCGGTTPFNGPAPQHYNDAASLAIQRGQVACPAEITSLGPVATAPAPSACLVRREPCSTRGNCRFQRNGLFSRCFALWWESEETQFSPCNR